MENRIEKEENVGEPLSKTVWALIGLVALLIIAVIFIYSIYSDNSARNSAPEEKKVIEKGLVIGVDKSDSIISLEVYKKNGKNFYSSITESGRAVIFDDDWQIKGETENPVVDLNKELPKSVTAIVPLNKSNFFLGGTLDGKFNLYVLQNAQLIVKEQIDDFKNSQMADPIAGSGSITHILINAARSTAVVVNFDGRAGIYNLSEEFIKRTGTIEMTAGMVAGNFSSETEIWTVAADGHIYVYDLNNPLKAGLDFNVSDFGRIRGADYKDGKFLIFGHSLEVKTASISIYDKKGIFQQTLTQKNITEKPVEEFGLNKSDSMKELPDISDLGDSFDDVQWLDQSRVLAVKDNKIYFLDVVNKKIQTFDMPLDFNETAVRFRQSGKFTFIVGTNAGRAFEIKLAIPESLIK